MQESNLMGERVQGWKVNYGDEDQHLVQVPHAWRQDVDVRFEGPVQYRTSIAVPSEPSFLWFEGVSYEAIIHIADEEVLTHRGIWDAFQVPLDRWMGKTVDVQVSVTKNGGERFPVKEVASGFLPYVYHTFGGIWGAVEIRTPQEIGNGSSVPSRVSHDSRIFVDGKPFYMRGLLHWGWYPELGHHNAPDDTIRREVKQAKSLGFNLVKFCLWVPPHRYLEILREEGLEAWLELPLWDPSSDPDKLQEIADEIERIVRQYRHHDNIIVWTVGCELSHATPPEYRERLVQLVKNLTGSPLVKDNSGGAEMYGGDLREFGHFFDFHPYCDTPFSPPVLDSLVPGPRPQQPILLGEFNDLDVHRDLVRLHDERPYWASAMPELNDVGVRWQHDLPRFLPLSPLANGDEMVRHEKLMASSREKALFVRKTVHEWVRSRDSISGYVITGWRDTPISTSGFIDDWDRLRFSPDECKSWNGPKTLFLIPSRRPPWVHGGNRPGWRDPFNHFTGQIYFQVGLHSESKCQGGLTWRIEDSSGKALARGAMEGPGLSELTSMQVGQVSWFCDQPGEYRLFTEFGSATNDWKFFVEEVPDFGQWSIDDPQGLAGDTKFGDGECLIQIGGWDRMANRLESGGSTLVFLNGQGTKPAPFWREATYEFSADAPFENQWERLLAVSGDLVIDPAFIAEFMPPTARTETLLNRVDVRTYDEAPVMIRAIGSHGSAIITTLRPYGGLGIQPSGFARNAAGSALLTELTNLLK